VPEGGSSNPHPQPTHHCTPPTFPFPLPGLQWEGHHLRVDRAAPKGEKGGVVFDPARSLFIGNLPLDVEVSWRQLGGVRRLPPGSLWRRQRVDVLAGWSRRVHSLPSAFP
jgi:hypothetical protein